MIWTVDLLVWKQPLYQLRHNHCPFFNITICILKLSEYLTKQQKAWSFYSQVKTIQIVFNNLAFCLILGMKSRMAIVRKCLNFLWKKDYNIDPGIRQRYIKWFSGLKQFLSRTKSLPERHFLVMEFSIRSDQRPQVRCFMIKLFEWEKYG